MECSRHDRGRSVTAVAGWSVGDEVLRPARPAAGTPSRSPSRSGSCCRSRAASRWSTPPALPEATCTVWSMVFGPRAGRLQPGERLPRPRRDERHRDDGDPAGPRARGAQVFATAGTPRKVAASAASWAPTSRSTTASEDFDERVATRPAAPASTSILDNMGALYLARNVDVAGDRRPADRARPAGRAARASSTSARCWQAGDGARGRAARPAGGAEGRRSSPRPQAARLAADRGRRGPAGHRPGPDRSTTRPRRTGVVEASEHIGKVSDAVARERGRPPEH